MNRTRIIFFAIIALALVVVVVGLIWSQLNRGPEPLEPETSDSRKLLDALCAYPDVPARIREIDLAAAPQVCITVTLEKDGTRLDLFSTLTTLGTPLDVTAQELRLESYFPADQRTAPWLQNSAASAAN